MQIRKSDENWVRLFCEVVREASAIDALSESERLTRLERLGDNLEFIARVIPSIADERFAEQLRYVGDAIELLEAAI